MFSELTIKAMNAPRVADDTINCDRCYEPVLAFYLDKWDYGTKICEDCYNYLEDLEDN